MITGAVFLNLVLSVSGGAAFGQAAEEWTALYKGRGGAIVVPNAVAVDPSGNVYVRARSMVAGATDSEYYTIKYDANGSLLWTSTYNGPQDKRDHARDMAVDSQGNVYVTGPSAGAGANTDDYATVKYGPDGRAIWTARYNGAANAVDRAHAVAVDSHGNVYVTGYSDGEGTSYDYATVKYDPDGKALWTARYDGTANRWDKAMTLVMDAEENIYVTGFSYGVLTFSDYATVKYDPDGEVLWTARYNGTGNSSDTAMAITTDPAGNVYVTGMSIGMDPGGDCVTIKYKQLKADSRPKAGARPD